MEINELRIKGCYKIRTSPKEDNRGSFSRIYCRKEFLAAGIESNFVQINESQNRKKGTFRGLHFQKRPFCESKLIRCASGSLIDILLDLRSGSKTFLNYLLINLTDHDGELIFIPNGVAHGFVTLEDNTTLIYHHTEYYNAESSAGIRHNDPKINLILPVPIEILSEQDKNFQFLPANFKGIDCEELI